MCREVGGRCVGRWVKVCREVCVGRWVKVCREVGEGV